uniref:Uncharacterized protein n=1 Tax=uncultured bacterium A1Q1_fos_2101 TaxID=1256561 RepID=L7VU80_9BACT|nr:hypothetical protein [uncultured bacterium A1Q1_fos_2101]
MSGAWTICGIWAGVFFALVGITIGVVSALLVTHVPKIGEWVDRRSDWWLP